MTLVKVTEGVSRQSFNSGHGIHAYPTFELSNAVQLLAKTAPRGRKLDPLLSGNPLRYLTHVS